MRRREFLKAAAAGVVVGAARRDALDTYVRRGMNTRHIPGVAGCIVRGDDIVRELSYGYADLSKKTPMGLDTLQNIASISKTFTATALMQLWEKGAFRLDDDVNAVLPFEVRGDAVITYRQLLTHTSSIADGTSYARHYGCGDPKIPLGTWLEEYFTPGGRFYDAARQFRNGRFFDQLRGARVDDRMTDVMRRQAAAGEPCDFVRSGERLPQFQQRKNQWTRRRGPTSRRDSLSCWGQVAPLEAPSGSRSAAMPPVGAPMASSRSASITSSMLSSLDERWLVASVSLVWLGVAAIRD